MYNSKLGLVLAIVFVAMISVVIVGCSSSDSGTNNDDNGGGGLSGNGSTVTFNLTAPEGSLNNGRSVRASVWLHWNDSLPLTYGDAAVSGGTATIPLDSIGDGTYAILVSIDSTGDGFVGDNPIEVGGYFFGALNVVVNADRTISVSGNYWQHAEAGSMVFGLDGIPAGHNGQPIGVGLFNDGEGVLTYPLPHAVAGGVGLIWNNSILIALHGGEPTSAVASVKSLPNGDYDLMAIVDVDGTFDDWNTPDFNPISEGDLVDYANITVDDQHPAEGLHRLTLSPEAVSMVTLSMSAHVPAEADGKPFYIMVFEDFGSDPLMVIEDSCAGGMASTSAVIWVPGAYHIAAVVDMDGSGVFASPNVGDLVWGALDINLTVDQTIALPDSVWQSMDQGSQLFLMNDVPAGNNGKLVTVGVFDDSASVMDNHQLPQFAGRGYVYNNSAMVIASATHAYDNPSHTLPNGEFDVWSVVDVDGDVGDYNDSTWVSFTPGDPYVKLDLTRNVLNPDNFETVAMPTNFATTRAISGTVTCPTYTSGKIYVYCFYQNPLSGGNVGTIAAARLTAPGAYTMPMFANDSVYVVAFWDADNSGENDGPTAGDLLGAYGMSQGGQLEDMVMVHTTAAQTTNINFSLWMEYAGPSAVVRSGW